MGTDIYKTYCGDHSAVYENVKSLHSTPGINVILYMSAIFQLKGRSGCYLDQQNIFFLDIIFATWFQNTHVILHDFNTLRDTYSPL